MRPKINGKNIKSALKILGFTTVLLNNTLPALGPNDENEKPVNRTVLILDFVNQKKSNDEDYLVTSIPDSFETSLKKTGTFELLPRSLAATTALTLGLSPEALGSEENAIKLGKAAGADVVLMGNFVVIGGEQKIIRIQAKAIDIESGRIADSDSAAAPADSNIFTGIAALSDRLANNMKTKLPPRPKVRTVVVTEREDKGGDAAAWLQLRKLRTQLGFGLPGLMRTANSELNKYYGSGFGSFAEISYWGFVFGVFLKYFAIADKQDLPQTAKLTMYGFDVGYQYFVPWRHQTKIGLIEYYAGLAGRFNFADETAADSGSNKFRSFGAYGRAGVALAIYNGFGAFIEGRFGYMPVGENRANVEGFQLCLGVAWEKK